MEKSKTRTEIKNKEIKWRLERVKPKRIQVLPYNVNLRKKNQIRSAPPGIGRRSDDVEVRSVTSQDIVDENNLRSVNSLVTERRKKRTPIWAIIIICLLAILIVACIITGFLLKDILIKNSSQNKEGVENVTLSPANETKQTSKVVTLMSTTNRQSTLDNNNFTSNFTLITYVMTTDKNWTSISQTTSTTTKGMTSFER